MRYLGTQSNVNDATTEGYGVVDAIGIYYCLQAIEFANSDVLVEAGTE